ncbi:hypothetical protein BGZ92_004099 [Podila epicladia]|nr:hypothetical protein BGZ92_004099 [Podila epicladia]
MFSKTNKRISLNPLDNRQYDNDTTPIMTDFAPPTPTTPTTPVPAYGGGGNGRGRGPGGGGGGGGRTLRSAPIHLPSSQANNHSAPPTPRSPAHPRQQPSQQQYGDGGGARRHNTYHQGHHQNSQQHQLPRSTRSLHHHHQQQQHHHQKPPPSPMYPPSPSAPSFRSQELHAGYQSTPQMYSPTSPSFHNQYPPSPGSPLPPYVERPPMAVVNSPPQYTSREMSYGRTGGASRSASDPELAMYENAAYYTNRNRKQQEQKELQRRRQQQQESSNDGECCGCFKSTAEFCPCLCFCCMFGGVAAA